MMNPLAFCPALLCHATYVHKKLVSWLTINHCDIALCFKKAVAWGVPVDHHTSNIWGIVSRREVESSAQLVTEKETSMPIIYCYGTNLVYQDLFLMDRCTIMSIMV